MGSSMGERGDVSVMQRFQPVEQFGTVCKCSCDTLPWRKERTDTRSALSSCRIKQEALKQRNERLKRAKMDFFALAHVIETSQGNCVLPATHMFERFRLDGG